ncbi:hypothetical protein ACWA2C_26315 [Priestia megaterium]
MNVKTESKYIKFKEDTFFFPSKDGVYFRNNNGYFTIRGKNMYPFIRNISDYLNGDYTLEDITKDLNHDQREKILKLINLLHNNGFLKYIDSPIILDELTQEHEGELAFLDYYTDSPRELFNKFQYYKIGIVGNGKLPQLIESSLKNMGAKEIQLIGNNYNNVEMDMVILCESDLDIETIKNIIDNNKLTVVIIGYKDNTAIISPFIQSTAKLSDFQSKFNHLNENHHTDITFTNSSILSNLLSFEIFKHVTKCLQPNLLENAYLLNMTTLHGEFVELKKKVNINVDFIKSFDSLCTEDGYEVSKIHRGNFKQLPLCKWEVRLKNKYSSSLPVINISSFGINHEEARFNTYYKVLEKLFQRDRTQFQNFKIFKDNSLPIDFKISDEAIFISCDINELIAKRKAILKAILSHQIENKKDRLLLNIDELISEDRTIYYYCKFLRILKKEFTVYAYKIVDDFFLIEVTNGEFRGTSLGFNEKASLENALMSFLLNIQCNRKHEVEIEDVLFRNLEGWKDEIIVRFLKKNNLELLVSDIKNKGISLDVSSVGVILKRGIQK